LEKWPLKCFFWDMWAIWYTQYMNRCFFHAFITGKVDLDLFAFLGPWTGHRTLPVSGDDQPGCSVIQNVTWK
jgi:hypothetical protein